MLAAASRTVAGAASGPPRSSATRFAQRSATPVRGASRRLRYPATARCRHRSAGRSARTFSHAHRFRSGKNRIVAARGRVGAGVGRVDAAARESRPRRHPRPRRSSPPPRADGGRARAHRAGRHRAAASQPPRTACVRHFRVAFRARIPASRRARSDSFATSAPDRRRGARAAFERARIGPSIPSNSARGVRRARRACTSNLAACAIAGIGARVGGGRHRTRPASAKGRPTVVDGGKKFAHFRAFGLVRREIGGVRGTEFFLPIQVAARASNASANARAHRSMRAKEKRERAETRATLGFQRCDGNSFARCAARARVSRRRALARRSRRRGRRGEEKFAGVVDSRKKRD
ncbi:hypothetical protein ABIE09_002264 [Lysobacter enzymogenes]|uniref:hypothetical protein n=1 Tax=Lysobacter enzymogenes TaxID=69 RepID=UPI003399E345